MSHRPCPYCGSTDSCAHWSHPPCQYCGDTSCSCPGGIDYNVDDRLPRGRFRLASNGRWIRDGRLTSEEMDRIIAEANEEKEMKDYIKNFNGFRWAEGAKVEAIRLGEAKIYGKRAVARLLVWDMMSDYRQRPWAEPMIKHTLDGIMEAMTQEEAKRIAAAMMAQLEEA